MKPMKAAKSHPIRIFPQKWKNYFRGLRKAFKVYLTIARKDFQDNENFSTRLIRPAIILLTKANYSLSHDHCKATTDVEKATRAIPHSPADCSSECLMKLNYLPT